MSSNTTITVAWPCGGNLASEGGPCRWEEVHHYDDDFLHRCPTGFMWCTTHLGTGSIDGPGACQKWGEP
jgi:hypothetical protein